MFSFPVRRAGPSDAEAISALAIETFPLGCPPTTDSRDIAQFAAAELTPARFAGFLADTNVEILLAEAADGLAGFAMIVYTQPHKMLASHGDSIAEVRKFYVHPRFHGLGVANALMKEAMTRLSSKKAVWLSVLVSNARAQAFYKRWGFQVIGQQQFRVGNDVQDDFVMSRFNAPDISD
jgi:ribosomal protein S18 acetylase RimI-like enzyme